MQDYLLIQTMPQQKAHAYSQRTSARQGRRRRALAAASGIAQSGTGSSSDGRQRSGHRGRRLGTRVDVDVLLGSAAGGRERGVVCAVGVDPAGPGRVRRVVRVVRVEDDVATGVGRGALAQAVPGASARGAAVEAVAGCRVVAHGRDGGRRGGGRAGPRGRGGAAAAAHGRIVDGEDGVAAVGATGGRVVGLARVQPAGSGPGIGIASSEDDKATWAVVVAVLPAICHAASRDGKVRARLRIVAEFGDERSRARSCSGSGRSACRSSSGCGGLSKDGLGMQ